MGLLALIFSRWTILLAQLRFCFAVCFSASSSLVRAGYRSGWMEEDVVGRWCHLLSDLDFTIERKACEVLSSG